MKKERFTEEQIIAVLRSTKRVLRRRMCVTRVSADGGEGPEPTLFDGFVHDALSDGRRFRILAVVDDYTRENLAWWPTPRCRAPE